MTKRPVTVTILALVLIASGVLGIAGHFSELASIRAESLAVLVVRLLAIVCGIFLLRRHNWARWLAMAWIAFHVAISYGDLQKFAVHIVVFLAFAYLLFRRDSQVYFGQPA